MATVRHCSAGKQLSANKNRQGRRFPARYL